jgi:hypothetical protein
VGDKARSLRRHFTDRFRDPRKTVGERFVWDYWYLESAAGAVQYSLMRTPAEMFFPERLYRQVSAVYNNNQCASRPLGVSFMSCPSSRVISQLLRLKSSSYTTSYTRFAHQIEDSLLDYGSTVLGCRAISPIWLSYYVDGCRQVSF